MAGRHCLSRKREFVPGRENSTEKREKGSMFEEEWKFKVTEYSGEVKHWKKSSVKKPYLSCEGYLNSILLARRAIQGF